MRRLLTFAAVVVALAFPAVAAADSGAFISKAGGGLTNVYGGDVGMAFPITWSMSSADSIKARLRLRNGANTGWAEIGVTDTGSGYSGQCDTGGVRKVYFRWQVAGGGSGCLLSIGISTGSFVDLKIRRCMLPNDSTWCAYVGGSLLTSKDLNFSNAGNGLQYKGTTSFGLDTTLANPGGTMSRTGFVQPIYTSQTGSTPTWFTITHADMCVNNPNQNFRVPWNWDYMEFYSDSPGTPDEC